MADFEVGTLFAKLKLDTSEIGRGFSAAVSGARAFAGRMRSLFRGLTAPIRAVGRAIFSLRGLLASVGVGLTGAGLVRRATEVDSISTAFGTLSRSVGLVSNTFLPRLREALKGTVSDLDIMRATNNAIVLGVVESQAQFAKLAEGARRLGRALGRSPVEALSDIVVGIGRQSRLILDNLGIIVKAEKAYEEYARVLGKTADQLTDNERRTAFLRAASKAVEETVAGLGPDVDSLADSWARLGAQVSNAFNAIAVGIVGSRLPNLLSEFLKSNLRQIEAFGRFVGRELGRAFEVVQEVFKQLRSRGFSQSLRDFFEFAIEVLKVGIRTLITTSIEVGLDIFKTTITEIGPDLIKFLLQFLGQIIAELVIAFRRAAFGKGSLNTAISDLLGGLAPVIGAGPLERFEARAKESAEAAEKEIRQAFEFENLPSASESAARIVESGGRIIGRAIDSTKDRLKADLEAARKELADNPFARILDIPLGGDRNKRLLRLESQGFVQPVVPIDVQPQVQGLELLLRKIKETRNALAERLDLQSGTTIGTIFKLADRAFIDSAENALVGLSEALGKLRVDSAQAATSITEAVSALKDQTAELARQAEVEPRAIAALLDQLRAVQDQAATLTQRTSENVFSGALGKAREEAQRLFSEGIIPQRGLDFQIGILDRLQNSMRGILGLRFGASLAEDLKKLRKGVFELNPLPKLIEEARFELEQLGRTPVEQVLPALRRQFRDLIEAAKPFPDLTRQINSQLNQLASIEIEKIQIEADFDKARQNFKQSAVEIGRVISETVRTIADHFLEAFQKGESIFKNLSDLGAELFRQSFNRVIDDLTAALEQGLNETFKDVPGGGAALGGLANALIGIAGLLLSKRKTQKEKTVEDFEAEIDSVEALRGVVAGPTNVAISKIGEQLKGALRQTELLLERIAINLEGGVAPARTFATAGGLSAGAAFRGSSSSING